MKLTHPASTQTIDVAPEHAENYKTQGWVEQAEKKAADKPKD